MGIIVRQSLKAGIGFYLGVLLGIINQMYISTKILSVEELALTRLILENALLFSAFTHLGTPLITDKFFGLFRSDAEAHRGVLPLLLVLPLIGIIIFCGLYVFFTPQITGYFSEKSPLVLRYHFLVIPLTVFWVYITVLEAYCRNNARIAVPNFIREVYLRLANILLIITLGLGWINFDGLMYLIVASYGLAVLFLVAYIVLLGKWYWRLPDRKLLTAGLLRQMLAYGGFALLGGLGVNLMLFIDRTMLAGEQGLISTGVFIIAAYIANIIEIPRKAISQISIPLLSTALSTGDHGQVRTLTRKSALHQLLVGGLFFLIIWINIDDIFYLIPKGETYVAGKYVVLFLALVKVLDIGTGLNTEIILYSKYYRWATVFIIGAAFLTLTLNAWLIPLHGVNGAAFATVITTIIYSLTRMLFVWNRFHIHPFSGRTLILFGIFVLLYLFSLLIPSSQETPLAVLGSITARSGLITLIFVVLILRLRLSPEINTIVRNFQTKWFG